MTQSTSNLDRRTFLQAGAAGLAAASLVTSAHAAQDKSPGGIPLRPLGRTGEKVTMIGLGGFHAAVPDLESDSLRL
ncbi:MAG: twin-arginine translocation signal domain-containing protein, partial [Isosphaeraceae bacterium]